MEFLRAEKYDKISSLILHNVALNSLEGIEILKDTLIFLDCSANCLRNLKGLENFTKLKYLDCSSNSLTNVDELKSSTNLKYFDCAVNHIKNLDGIMNAKNMKWIHIYENHTRDMKWVVNFKKLKMLYAGLNGIKNLDGIENLQELKCCSINENLFMDDETIKLLHLKKLVTLYIGRYDIELTNIKFAKYLRNLRYLYVTSPALQNLNGIENCEKLEKVEIFRSKKLSIFPNLLKLKRLRHLMLYNSPIISHKGLPENITFYHDKFDVYCPMEAEPYVTIDLHEVSGIRKFLNISENTKHLKISWFSWIGDKNIINKLYEFF